MKVDDVSSRSYSEAAMKLREALIAQSPSLELQRAAANEIARLDAQIAERNLELLTASTENEELLALLGSLLEYAGRYADLNDEPEDGDCQRVCRQAQALIKRVPT